jgi:hypothetical protein
MKSISTIQFGRVFLSLRTDEILVMDKKGWTKTTRVICHVIQADTMKYISAGVSIKSPREKNGDQLEGLAKASRLAFVRAIRKFDIRADRQKLGKAWEKARGGN